MYDGDAKVGAATVYPNQGTRRRPQWVSRLLGISRRRPRVGGTFAGRRILKVYRGPQPDRMTYDTDMPLRWPGLKAYVDKRGGTALLVAARAPRDD